MKEMEEILRQSVVGKCSIMVGVFGSGEDFLIGHQVHFLFLVGSNQANKKTIEISKEENIV